MKKALTAVLACLVLNPILAAAQAYPAKPVRILTSTPGNFHDIVARRIAQSLSERWKQPVVVENRGGAGAILAATAAAQAPADGYTLLVTDRTALAVQPSLNSHLPYDPLRDLAPVTLVAAAPMLLLVHPSVPSNSLPALITYLQGASSPVPFASAGPGTANHLTGELLKEMLGANLMNVHYKGSPAAMTSLLAGETKAAFMLVTVGLPHVRAGKVRALAITGKERFFGMAEIPTVAELGYPALQSDLWLAMMAPAHTPQPIIAAVHRDVVDILKEPSLRTMFAAQGAIVAQSTPEELSELIRTETTKWKKVIEVAKININ